MRRVTLIGANGFVGSAFASYLSSAPNLKVFQVTRGNYAEYAGVRSDVVIDAAGNSKKYLAEAEPVKEFDLSVAHRLRTLRDFPAEMHVHISSVDVYSNLNSPDTTREYSPIGLAAVSHYGAHKLMAEQLVQHYAKNWLVVRLAGMVGERLRKNPVYDVLHGHPLRISPKSGYQFMTTGDVARTVWTLVTRGLSGEIFNICGKGLITPLEIANLAGCELDLSLLRPMPPPRMVHINTEKIERLVPMPDTHRSVADFISGWQRQRYQRESTACLR